MAITIVNGTAVNASAAAAGTTGITITKPANLADGDVLYAFITRTNFANSAAWTNSQGFSEIGPVAANQGTSSGNDVQLTILRKVITNAAGEPANYTFVNTQATTYQIAGIIVPLRGVDTSTPEDAALPAFVFGNNIPAPASLNMTSATDNAFAIAMMMESLTTIAGATAVAPSTYTLLPGADVSSLTGSADNHTILAYKTLGVAGSSTGTNSWQNTGTTATVESLAAGVLVRAAVVASAPVAEPVFTLQAVKRASYW